MFYLVIRLNIELYLLPSQGTYSIVCPSASSTQKMQPQNLLDQHLYDGGAVAAAATAAATVGSAVEVQEGEIVEYFCGSYHGGLGLQFFRWCEKEDERKGSDDGERASGKTRGGGAEVGPMRGISHRSYLMLQVD